MENNQPKKKNAGLTALIALLLVVTTVASCIGIYAWARYISSQNGNATAPVAKWNFNVSLKKGQNTVTLGSDPIDLATTAAHVANGKIAPGTSGTFDIEIDTTGTEVDLQYDVTISLENCPRNITFSKKGLGEQNFTVISPAKTGDETERTRTGITFSKYVANGQNGVFTETIKWDWPYELTGNDSTTNELYTAEQKTAYDTRDNQDQGRTVTMNITVIGTEMLHAPVPTVQSQAQAGNVHVGESVNYNPGTLTTASIKLPEGATIEGSKLASVTMPEGASLYGTINADSAGDWEVLDVNQTTGEVLIMPKTYSPTRLKLEGKDGYDNAITALNNVASIYLNPTYATSARSLTVEDVNKREEYTPNGDSAEYTWNHRYGMNPTTLDITDTGSDSNTPSQTYTSTATTGYYGYNTNNFSNMNCWLASRCVSLGSGSCNFYVRGLSSGNVYYYDLFYVDSNGYTNDGSSSYPVVPVVSLKSNIQMERDETNGIWMLNNDSSIFTPEEPLPEVATGTATATE